jgi:hypothetical protein
VALVVAAAIAAAAPASLDDSAHELLGAMPTTWRRRVLQRLVIVIPAVTVAWALAVLAMFGTGGDRRLPTLGALAALGVAVGLIAARTRPGAAAAIGVATPLAAVASRWLLPNDDRLDSIGTLWAEHPWPTIFTTLVAAAIATTDPAVSVSDVARRFAGSRHK